MGITVNIKELEEFRDKLEQLGKDSEFIYTDLTKSVARILLAKVRYKTPFKTKTLMRGWEASGVTKSGSEYTVTISNNTKYAVYVEYGHRTAVKKDGKIGWVKGGFMLTKSEIEMNRNIDSILKKKLNKIIKDRLK